MLKWHTVYERHKFEASVCMLEVETVDVSMECMFFNAPEMYRMKSCSYVKSLVQASVTV